MRWVGLLVVASIAAGCSLAVDLSDLASDAATETGASDAATDASVSFCATRGDADTLCADFDEGSLTAGWAKVVGPVDLFDGSARANLGSTDTAAYLYANPIATASAVDFTTKVLLPADAGAGELQVLVLLLMASRYPELILQQTYGSSAGTAIIESNVASDGGRTIVGSYSLSQLIPPGTWVDLSFHIEPSDASSSSHLTVSLGGVPVVDQTLASSSGWTPGRFAIELGVSARTTLNAVAVSYDDVTLDLH